MVSVMINISAFLSQPFTLTTIVALTFNILYKRILLILHFVFLVHQFIEICQTSDTNPGLNAGTFVVFD